MSKGSLGQSKVGTLTKQDPEIVGPTVGQGLTTKALVATGLSLVGILAHLAFRFEFSFGVGAVVATIHDLLITLHALCRNGLPHQLKAGRDQGALRDHGTRHERRVRG